MRLSYLKIVRDGRTDGERETHTHMVDMKSRKVESGKNMKGNEEGKQKLIHEGVLKAVHKFNQETSLVAYMLIFVLRYICK